MTGAQWAIAGTVVAALVGGAIVVYRRRRRPGDPVPTGLGGAGRGEVYALARAIGSEEPRSPALIQEAVGFAVRNHARNLKRTIERTVAPNGWGSQEGGGYVTTRLEPTARHLEIAAAVLAPGAMDITGGATHFDRPKVQRAAIRSGRPGYKTPPEEVARRRVAGGLEMVVLPGVDPDDFRMWRPARRDRRAVS